MGKTIVKLLPVVFLLILAATILVASDIKMSTDLKIVIAFLETIVSTTIIELLIFFVDFKKNKSIVSIAGFISLLVYVAIAIIVVVMAHKTMKNLDFSAIQKFYEKVEKLQRVEGIALEVIAILKYYSIFNLISISTDDVLVIISKISAYVSVLVYHGLCMGEKLSDFLTKVKSVSKEVIPIAIFAFVVYQLFAEEEQQTREVIEESSQDKPKTDFSTSNGPRFRNPALEAQQARLAEQQNQANQSPQNPMGQTQQMNQPPVFNNGGMMNQPPMMNQQPIMNSGQMLNQPPIMNNNQMLNQPPIMSGGQPSVMPPNNNGQPY